MDQKYTKIKLGSKESFGVVPIRGSKGNYEVLLLQSVNGHWSFPKGKQEDGEEPFETARREFVEETGIQDIELKEDPIFEEHYNVPTEAGLVPKVVKYFLGFVNPSARANVQEKEIRNSKWLSLNSVEKQITYEESKEMIRAVREYLEEQ